MDVLQEINLMIDHTEVILWEMQLLQELLSTGIHINIFFIHRAHHVWFDEYNYRFSIEDMHSPCSLLLQQDPEGHFYR